MTTIVSVFKGTNNKYQCELLKNWIEVNFRCGNPIDLVFGQDNDIPFNDPNSLYLIIGTLDNPENWIILKVLNRNTYNLHRPIIDISEFLNKYGDYYLGDTVNYFNPDDSEKFSSKIVGMKLQDSVVNCILDPKPDWVLNKEIGIYLDSKKINKIRKNTTLSTISPDYTVVGWRCNYCGLILRSKKPHKCNGHYRCKKLSFTEIIEECNILELPEGYKVSEIKGNRIKLEK